MTEEQDTFEFARPKKKWSASALLNCPICEQSFLPKREWQKFCSPKCQIKYWKMKPQKDPTSETRKCAYCKTSYTQKIEESNPLAHYCPKCRELVTSVIGQP